MKPTFTQVYGTLRDPKKEEQRQFARAVASSFKEETLRFGIEITTCTHSEWHYITEIYRECTRCERRMFLISPKLGWAFERIRS